MELIWIGGFVTLLALIFIGLLISDYRERKKIEMESRKYFTPGRERKRRFW